MGMTIGVDASSDGALDQIENDITNTAWTMPSGIQDITGLDKSAMERLLLLADFSITLNGVFNDAAGKSHGVFKDYRTMFAGQVTRTCTIIHSGQTLTNEVLFTDYALTRAQDGSLVWSAPGQLASGTVPAWS